MILRYPNKPMEDYERSISRYEKEGCWRTTAKLDGYRCFTIRDKSKALATKFGLEACAKGKDNSLFFLTRRDQAKGGPTPIPVRQEIIDSIEKMDLPDQTFLDGEWLARRTIGESPEKLFLFDVLWWADDWRGDVAYENRSQQLESFLSGKLNEFVSVPESVSSGFQEFFNKMKTIPYTEGMVMKHIYGVVKGDLKACQKYPLQVKIKHRSGSSGRDIVLP